MFSPGDHTQPRAGSAFPLTCCILFAAGLCAGFSLSLTWFSAALLPAAGALLLQVMGRRHDLARHLLALGCFALGFLGASLCWLGLGLYRPPVNQLSSAALLWLAIVGLQLLVYLACYVFIDAPARLIERRSGGRRSLVVQTLVLATAWSLAEGLRSIGPLALPWGLWGYGAIDNPLLGGIYPVGGSLGAAWLQWLLAGLWLFWVQRLRQVRNGTWRQIRMPALLSLAWLAAAMPLGGIEWTQAADSGLQIRIVHTHWPAEEKYLPHNQALAASMLEQAAHSPQADLVVFPELFLVQHPSAFPRDWRSRIAQLARESKTGLLFGAPGLAREERPGEPIAGQQNTLVLIDETGLAHSYAKQLLLPFTEYLPSSPWVQWIWPLLYRYPLADMVPGPPVQDPLRISGVQLGPMICSELAAPVLSAGQGAGAGLVVSPASDSWIPSRLYLLQAHNLARVRAAELQKPLVRANNVGLSSFIDHRGRVLAAWSGEAGSGSSHMTPRNGATPYSRLASTLAAAFNP
ncbi:apolipoprotein N-acyltransferase [Comamonas composti]|uniref:apolipoprotein N-acyltransferase n=1 Tax=Comamonas composti TaxID=408558 RepID=UPI000420EA64|nr:apolipoprotein N-acyltransferase [Comamonas composti]